MFSTDPVIMLIILGLPFLAAVLAPSAVRVFGGAAGWLLAIFPAIIFLQILGLSDTISAGGTVQGGIQWVPSLNVELSYLFDGLSFVFGLLVTGIGTLVVIYAGGYLKGHPQQGRFFSFLFLFMGAMLGLVAADNLYALFVLWELTSITSFLLIGFGNQRAASRRAALQALIITGGGGLILMAGIVTLHMITGEASLSGVLASGDTLRNSPLYLMAFVLVLGGCFTKSAQFPLHFWLPNAMEAPTPVSAYLHSATMVKAGVYLLMRLNPVMGETALWETVLPIFGGTTLLVGTFLAVRQTDLKLMLAYTTVASLGLLVMLTGWGTEKAIEGAVLYLVAHSLFKGCLFMVAGTIDHEAGTRDVTKLAGLRKVMPITFAAACLAALSMGGLPFFYGFMAKEEMYYGLLGSDWSLLILAVAILGNALMLVIGAAVALKPMLGDKPDHLSKAHEGPASLWLGPVVLSGLGLIGALFSGATHKLISSPMASAVYGDAVTVKILGFPTYWSTPLALSIVTIALGVLFYTQIDKLRAAMASVLNAIGWGPDRGFDQAVSGLVRFSYGFTSSLQSGRLEVYMVVTFIFVALSLWVPLLLGGEMPDWPVFAAFQFHVWAIIALAVVGLIAVVNAKSRLNAIISLGIQGFAVALIFMLFGAPDLSFTQFMVETLSVVILALAMTKLSLTPSDHRGWGQFVLDGGVALACGAGLTIALIAATAGPFNTNLSDFFTEYSRIIAHGRNIVNVIIVDYRGTDTLGEIGVVVITGLAIHALIRIRASKVRAVEGEDAAKEVAAPKAAATEGAR
ncbi:MAG: putative monovalent cation/H+ antiporter subunit A [Pseudomonadota bacterium]